MAQEDDKRILKGEEILDFLDQNRQEGFTHLEMKKPGTGERVIVPIPEFSDGLEKLTDEQVDAALKSLEAMADEGDKDEK